MLFVQSGEKEYRMNRIWLGIIITFFAVGGIFAVIYLNVRENKNVSTATVSETSDSQHDAGHTNDDAPSGRKSLNSENNTSGEVLEGDVRMNIKDYAFSKKYVKVRKGTTITWTNQDSARHDVMPDKPSGNFKASELLAKGESYSYTFNSAGKFTYYCSPHPYMQGEVEVVE